MNILVINGPNINLLGEREPDIYGNKSYEDLVYEISHYAAGKNVFVKFLQSNHEGDLIDWIQEAKDERDGLIINPAGYSHTSIAILDALLATKLPIVEVHFTDLTKREDFRQKSITSLAAEKVIMGKGASGYLEALDYLTRSLED